MILRKNMVVVVTILILSNVLCNTARAENLSKTTVTGQVKPTLINVSAPAKVLFSIDPNAEKNEQFTSSFITIENYSNAPVKVNIKRNAENFMQSKGSTWMPEDVMPQDYDWDGMGTKESEKYLSLGVKAIDNGWRRLIRKNVLFVKEQNDSTKSIEFGEINSHASVQLTLVCYYGLSFSDKKECTYNIIWSFSLGE